MVRKHLFAITVIAAAASALAAPAQAARSGGQTIITCDRQGCRPDNPADARPARAARERAAVRRPLHSRSPAKASRRASYGGGNVRSGKTGATATVGAAYAPRFQAYVDAIEASGPETAVRFMGGIRRGHCSERSKHPCGMALDVCQLSRGVVDARCHLPSPAALSRLAEAHGLIEGGRWCSSDYGHAEVAPGAALCAGRRYAVGRAIVPPAVHRVVHRRHFKLAAVR